MEAFNQNIYRWYNINKRDLPWRRTRDPYKIWISEVILQQTRIDQGMGYYLRFIERFPTVKSLAQAHEDQVLKLWQGLGYYSRARNLHSAAKTILNEYKGCFPDSYEKLLELKGIGSYTAAAIASIAYDQCHPAIDGNVNRVLSRHFGIYEPVDGSIGKKLIHELATLLMPFKDSGMHNQALMEMGALQCLPKSPDCQQCPVHHSCYAFQHNQVNLLPVKTSRTKQRKRYFYYYYMETDGHIYLEKRTKGDIWQNLYQLPLFEAADAIDEGDLLKNNWLSLPDECQIYIQEVSSVKKHILSHQVIYSRFIRARINNPVKLEGRYLRVNKKDISNFAVPRLIEHYFEEVCIKKI